MTFLRFVIDGKMIDEQAWEIRVHPETLERSPIHVRCLQRRIVDSMAFPLPPQGEAEDIPNAALHKRLCTTPVASDMFSVYLNIIQRNPGTEDMETFGRYLATTLLNH